MPFTRTGSGSLSTCGLSAAAELGALVPLGWRLGLFGSASLCPNNGACASGASDLDLPLVHPPALEKQASALRRLLIAEVAVRGLVADITVLSTQELLSTDFWDSEGVIGLGAFVDGCAERLGHLRACPDRRPSA